MRVLHTPDWRGSNPYQELLASCLAPLGVESRFAAPSAGLPLLREARRQRAELVHVHASEAYIIDPRLPWAVARSMRFLAELLVLRLLGVPVVHTMHNLTSHRRYHPALEGWATRAFLALSSRILVHGPSALPVIAASHGAGAASRCRVVPHGHFQAAYPSSPGREEARRRLGIPPEGRLLLFLGQVLSYKGVVEAVEEARRLKGEFLVLIAGRCREDGLEERLREAAGADERFRLDLRYLPGGEVAAHLDASDLVLLPYREVFTSGGLVLAMSFGRPVLISDTGLVRDYVGEEGAFFFPAGDREGMAAALRRALAAGDEELRRMGETNRQAARQWTWERAAALTMEAYQESLGGRAGRR